MYNISPNIFTIIKQRKKYHIIGKDFEILPTLVVYPKIYRISFVKVNYKNHSRFDQTILCILGFIGIRT